MFRRASIFFLLTILLTCSQSFQNFAVAGEWAPTLTVASLEDKLLEEINRERVLNQLPPLHRSDSLNAIAKSHSADMLERSYFDHRTPEGLGLKERFEKSRFTNWRRIAENISSSRSCSSFDPVKAAVQGWMNSPGHRHNILDKQMQETGIGIAMDTQGKVYYITQVFVAPK